MRSRLLFVVVFMLAANSLAASLVVHPFESQDVLLGVAVADMVAESFSGNATVIGPDLAPSLMPPFVVEGGFINLLALVGPAAMTGPNGATLLRDAIGADVAVTGSIALRDQGYRLDLIIEDAHGMRRIAIEAAEDSAASLAQQASVLVGGSLGMRPQPIFGPVDLSGAYGEYVRALTLVGAGLLSDASALLARAAEQEALPERAQALVDDLDALFEGADSPRSARMAVLSLSLPNIDEARSMEYFQRMQEDTGLPVVDVWLGTLASSVNDKAAATAAFDAAADAYSFGRVGRAAFRQARGLPGVDDDLSQVMAGWPDGDVGAATLLGAALVAGQVADDAGERTALEAAGHAAPYLTYPFERGSFLAFDADDALQAARLLAVAVELAPEEPLYVTNLGWATYLLGDLKSSERYSLRALELDPSQFIAAYNLGLVRTVTGRLEQALKDYAAAVRFDAGVDDEAIHDLENARERYPDQPAVWFSLANLYEADGRRSDARDAYRTYLQLAPADAALRSVAEQRATSLDGPAAELQVYGDVSVLLGRRGVEAAPYQPGDPLYPSFELGTPGDALPGQVAVTLRLLDADGAERASAEETVTVPADAVGFVVDDLELALPFELAEGTYRLTVLAEATEDRSATAEATLEVSGAPSALRQLLGRGIAMRSLSSDAPLYSSADLSSGRQLSESLLAELRASVDAAEGALPEVVTGRFKGMSGAEVFLQSGPDDVLEFVAYLLRSGARASSFTFVDGYAQWVVDGAPKAPDGSR